VHTGLLIHDDIIDRDEVRRGEEALHISYRSEEFSDRQARNLALCSGDVAYFLAFRAISESEVQSSKALSVFSSTFSRVGLGEMSDIELSGQASETDQVIQMYRDKTASYTFALPLRLAAVLATGEDRTDLKDLGLELGVLYQIKDDHLDLFSGTEDTGKPEVSDLVEGKTTLHTELLEQRNGTEINGDISEEEARQLVSEMREHSIDSAVEQKMEDRKKEIEEKIETLDGGLGNLVAQVVELVVERER
jgi:geranylgeranyl pyrophosphate synthase